MFHFHLRRLFEKRESDTERERNGGNTQIGVSCWASQLACADSAAYRGRDAQNNPFNKNNDLKPLRGFQGISGKERREGRCQDSLGKGHELFEAGRRRCGCIWTRTEVGAAVMGEMAAPHSVVKAGSTCSRIRREQVGRIPRRQTICTIRPRMGEVTVLDAPQCENSFPIEN